MAQHIPDTLQETLSQGSAQPILCPVPPPTQGSGTLTADGSTDPRLCLLHCPFLAFPKNGGKTETV